MKAIQRRLQALERPKDGQIVVWWPDDPKPEGWDTAGIAVSFPDCQCCQKVTE